jgi:4-oxalocrotonate tautomerase
MPYINLKVAGELSIDQKREIAKQFTKTIKDVTGKSPESVYLVFEEIDRTNWAKGDKLLSD